MGSAEISEARVNALAFASDILALIERNEYLKEENPRLREEIERNQEFVNELNKNHDSMWDAVGTLADGERK